MIKRKKKSKERIDENRKNIKAQNEFFLRIWKKRKHYSEVSGVFLGHTPLTTYFHHILSKSKYPDLRFEEDNIILLTQDEHASVEMNMYKYEEINKRREKLLKMYYFHEYPEHVQIGLQNEDISIEEAIKIKQYG